MSKAEEIKKYLEVNKLDTNEKNSMEKEQQEEAAEKSILNNSKLKYCNNPKYWNRQARASSVDPDQDLHCLPLIQQFVATSVDSKMDFFKGISGKACTINRIIN